MDDFGAEAYDHEAKAAILWKYFKERLDTTSQTCNPLNFESLISKWDNLADLEFTFTQKEIDDVVKNLPTDKALGLDGFNGAFLRKCWVIIKQDIYTMIWVF